MELGHRLHIWCLTDVYWPHQNLCSKWDQNGAKKNPEDFALQSHIRPQIGGPDEVQDFSFIFSILWSVLKMNVGLFGIMYWNELKMSMRVRTLSPLANRKIKLRVDSKNRPIESKTQISFSTHEKNPNVCQKRQSFPACWQAPYLISGMRLQSAPLVRAEVQYVEEVGRYGTVNMVHIATIHIHGITRLMVHWCVPVQSCRKKDQKNEFVL